MTRRATYLLTACLLAAATSPADAQIDASRRDVGIATATPTGNYFGIGNALCRVLQRQGLYLETGDVTSLGCGATATSGSFQNVELLRNRGTDFALVQSDVMFQAYNGTGRFEGRRVDTLRSLLSLNQEAFQVLAGRGTNVATWSDLKGKKVNLGPTGTTANTVFKELLAIHNVDEKWLTQGLTLPVSTHTVELCEGNIEALGQTTGVPSSSISAAAQRCGANLVALDTPQIRKYVADRPFYAATLIPKDTYHGQSIDIRTFGVLATLVATADTPEIAAYSMVRAVFEGLQDLKAMQPVLAGLVERQMITDGLSAPLHSGALRYYRERGWMKEELPPTPVSLPETVDALAAAAATQPAPQVSTPQAPRTTGAAPATTPRKGAKSNASGKGRGAAGPT
jgi:uncharacterized protein